MKSVSLSTLASWCGGEAHGVDVEVTSVATDSRVLAAAALFVALRGERVDGHDFVAQAAANGAAAALVMRTLAVELPQIRVENPLLAIGKIAAALRRGRDTIVLALTGSNGKTTVKSLLASVLERVGSTYANPGNRNNELGMPLALIEQPEDARFGVFEMGAGAPGDIDFLAKIARPDVALVNNVAPAHLERMGSLLGIAQTKGAIYAGLDSEGTAVINADDAFAPWFEQRLPPCRRMSFALATSADVTAEHLRIDNGGCDFDLATPVGRVNVRLRLGGRHNVSNALAAASMALAVKAPLAAIVEGLERVGAMPGRLQEFQLANGACLIDDSYNANPGSVAAAIQTLSGLSTPRWLVLGDLRELGPAAVALHARIGADAKAAGIDALWTVGPLAAAAAQAFGANAQHFESQAGLIEALKTALSAGVNCLVKGSRGSRMDRVVSALGAATEVENAA